MHCTPLDNKPTRLTVRVAPTLSLKCLSKCRGGGQLSRLGQHLLRTRLHLAAVRTPTQLINGLKAHSLCSGRSGFDSHALLRSSAAAERQLVTSRASTNYYLPPFEIGDLSPLLFAYATSISELWSQTFVSLPAKHCKCHQLT